MQCNFMLDLMGILELLKFFSAQNLTVKYINKCIELLQVHLMQSRTMVNRPIYDR